MNEACRTATAGGTPPATMPEETVEVAISPQVGWENVVSNEAPRLIELATCQEWYQRIEVLSARALTHLDEHPESSASMRSSTVVDSWSE